MIGAIIILMSLMNASCSHHKISRDWSGGGTATRFRGRCALGDRL